MPRQNPRVDPVEITAGRLHLRPWQPGDEAAALEACTDPDTLRWTNVPHDYTLEHARTWVSETAAAGWESGKDVSFAVCDSTSAVVLANVALRPSSDPGVWDVGYWCRPSARGQSVVPEALGALARWAFAVLEARRIEWMAQVGN